jgi:hypothetical protein
MSRGGWDQRPCHRDLRGVGGPVALCTTSETKIGQGGVKRRDIHRNIKKLLLNNTSFDQK